MKQGIVKFSKEFITPTGLKEWVGIEWPVDFENDNVMGAFNQAKKAVCDFQLASAGNIESMPNPMPQVIQVQPEDRRIGIMADDIMSCQDLITLDTYKLLVKGKLELEAAYKTRRSQIISIETKDILDRTNALHNGK
jgi:hypothetical protein